MDKLEKVTQLKKKKSYKKIFPSLIFDLHHFELPKCCERPQTPKHILQFHYKQ